MGNSAHYVAVRPDRDLQPVRRFECFTADLHRLADWLQSCGVQIVALQSTGVYWIPLYDILENAACRYIWSTHTKNLPGRKSDVQESQWLLKLHTYGLLNNSESQFRTMKYRPEFPDRFGCIQDSRAFSQGFFRWYNEEHRHSGLALLTPAMVHYKQTALILEQRQTVLDAAYQAHPERFVHQAPKPADVPTEVWINKPLNSNENTH